MRNKKGFAPLEGLLILIIVGLLGGVGWYVYQAKNNADKSLSNANSTNSQYKVQPKKPSAADPTANWQSISTPDGTISLKYPNNLYAQICTKIDGAKFIGLSPYKDGKGACGNYENPGYMTFSYQTTAPEMYSYEKCEDTSSDSDYKVTRSKVKINSRIVCLIISTRVSKNQPYIYTYVKGREYGFEDKGKSYRAEYTQFDDYPDLEKDFDTIYSKTLEFK